MIHRVTKTILLALALIASGPAAAAEPGVAYEFSVIPGEDGQPDFGRPFRVVASPDGRHVYVITFPGELQPESLLTFERTAQGLELVDTIVSVDGGVEFSGAMIDLSADGRLLVLGSFTPHPVHVFERDPATGLLTHVQSIDHPDLDHVDGVDAGHHAIVWGRRAFPETGSTLLLLERQDAPAATLRRNRLAERLILLGNPFYFPERVETAAVADDESATWGAVTVDRVLTVTRGRQECDWPPPVWLPHAGEFPVEYMTVVVTPFGALVGVQAADGSQLWATVLPDPTSCDVALGGFQPAPEVAGDPVFFESEVETRGESEVSVENFFTTERFAKGEWHGLAGRYALLGPELEVEEELTLETLLPDGSGRQLDLGITGRLPAPGASELGGKAAHGETYRYVYTTSPNPPALHAYRYTPVEAGAPPPPSDEWLTTPAVPGFEFQVRIRAGGTSRAGEKVAGCIGETLCVSGAVPGRAEVFARVVGPKPNGKLWPTLVKFTTSEVEVWVRQTATSQIRHYLLAGAAPGTDELPGRADKEGFDPAGQAATAPARVPLSQGAVPAPTTLPVPDDPEPPAGPWLRTPGLPGFRVKVRITAGGNAIAGQKVPACIAETLCVSGALAGRAEVFVRVVGPKPNGKLWPTVAKFSTSRVEVWIEQTASGEMAYYDLSAVAPGGRFLVLDGLFDRGGFDPL